MRIYNATKSQLNVPYSGSLRLSIAPKAVSGDILGSTDFISLLVTSYDSTELAIIVSGPFELSLCAQVPTAANYVVQSLDEAIKRFCKEEPKAVEPVTEAPVVEEEVLATPYPVVEEAPAPKKKAAPKKKVAPKKKAEKTDE